MRVRSLFSNYYFAKVVLGYSKLVDHFHQEEMERFITKWANGERMQCIEWSRAFFKTTCFTLATGIWIVLPYNDEDTQYAIEQLQIPEDVWFSRMALHDQDATQLYAFETAANAKKKVGQVKWHFEENELFRGLFPEIAYTGQELPWNNDCLRIRRVGDRRKDQEGTFEAIGAGAALQSRHYKIVWEDDLIGEAARKSPQVMEDTIGWHQRLHGAFEHAPSQIRFVVANRWGYNDLNNHIRQKEPEFVFHTRSAWELSDTTGQEEAVFPEEYSIEELEKLRGKMSAYDFSCQYLNQPTLPGEKEVELSKLHTYTVAEDGTMECNCGAKWLLSQCYRYLSFDPYNAKGGGSTSLPALVVKATSPDEHIFLVDYFLGKTNYGKIYDRIFHFNDVYRPRLFTYEDVGHQNMTEFHIREVQKTVEFKAAHRDFPRIVGCKTGNRSKEIRIRESLFPLIEKKKFSYRSRQVAFIQQLETFPHRALDHDYDLLDALAQGVDLLRFPETDDSSISKKSEEDAYLAQLNRPYSHAGTL